MGWHLNDLTLATGAPQADGMPSGYVFESQATQHVTYVGTDFHVHELWWDANGWHHNDLTNTANAPTAINAGRGYIFRCTQHLDYFGLAGGVQEVWYDHQGWHPNNLSNATGAVVTYTGRATGYAFPAQGTQHVNFPDLNGHIHEFWWSNNAWHHNDLTVAAAAPLSAANPTGYVFPSQGTQHVNYVGQDTHVHELWWDAAGWHHNDLTAATGSPLARVNHDATGYVFASQGTQHVNYVGLDDHVHELWWDINGWHHNDLTAATGSPNSAVQPYGYVFAGTLHVNYLGVDHHVHELWWDSGGWHHNDLTNAVGAPATTFGEPRGYGFESQGTQHVIYKDDAGHVIELFWTP
jgi:hypothetical protein